jgi:hypothetical protein
MWRTKILPPDDQRAELDRELAAIPNVVEKFRPVITRNKTRGNTAHQASWKLLSVHSEMVLKMTEMLRARLMDNRMEDDEAWKKLADYIALHEDETDEVFDIKRFQSSIQRR